jgi:predicted PurR-regulated permease PerM
VSAWRPPLWYDRLAGIAWRAVIVIVAAALIVTGIVGLSSVILPTVLGLLFACGLHPVARWLRRRGLGPALAAAASVFALLIAVLLVAWLAVRVVVDQWATITSWLKAGQATLEDTAADGGVHESTAVSIGADIGELVSDATSVLVRGFVHLLPAAASVVTTVLLSFVVAFFFLKDGAGMWRWIVDRLGETGDLTDRIGRRVWEALTGFIVGQTVIAAADAGMITIGALILGVPQPGAIFMLTLFGAYIPYIGAFVSGLVAVLLALGEGGMPRGVAMLAVVLFVQLLEGNVLQPWIQGRAVRLHPLVIALSVTAGGALAGFLGVFLAVPVTAAGFVTLSELRAAGIVGPPVTGEAEPASAVPAEEPP